MENRVERSVTVDGAGTTALRGTSFSPPAPLRSHVVWPTSRVVVIDRRRWKHLRLLGVLLGIGFLCYRFMHWVRWREQPDPATGVAVELRPAHQVIKAGEVPDLSVLLVNRGNQEVVLVQPGDGSDCGWRTPLIEWSRSRWFHGLRCGNITALKPEEVFVLKPGESRQLSGWVGVPPLAGPGRYRVAVRYTNAPDQPWSGVPLGEHDAKALQEVRQTTRVSAVSNSVEIVVEK